MTSQIILESITKRFPPSTDALCGVDARIEEGERVAIVGPSGSGKSTLLTILGLLDVPTGGSFTLEGRDVLKLDRGERITLRRDYIGFVFQAFHLLQHLTSVENVQLALELHGVNANDAVGRAREALARVGMTHRANALPGTLSGGEQQRVAIARALAAEPKILLCDEPTGNLDSANSERILELLLEVTAASTVVIVTHSLEVAERCDRVITLHDGRVVA